MFGAMIPFTTKADKIDKSNSHGIAIESLHCYLDARRMRCYI